LLDAILKIGRFGRRSIRGTMTILVLASVSIAVTLVTTMMPWRDGGARLALSLLVDLAAGLAAALAGLAVARRLQRRIAAPVVALTEAMAQARQTHDYGLRAEIEADDEVGDLVAGFNEMMAELRTRDAALAMRLASLDRTLAERTAALEAAEAVAEAASSAKRDFLSVVSDEIDAPMSGIAAMAQALAEANGLPPRQRRLAESIAKSGASLGAIVRDVMDLQRREVDKLELQAAPTDPAEVVEDVTALFWEHARAKGLDLAAHVDPATPALVETDPMRLRQAVGHLVSQAIRLTPSGAVMVQGAPKGEALRFAVRGAGEGVDKAQIATLLAAPGLAACRRVVEAMGGRLFVTSEAGKGTVFGFDLPARTLAEAPSWPGLEGDLAVLQISGDATRTAVTRYLRASGMALAGEDPQEEGAALVIGDAGALADQPRHRAPVICLGEAGHSVEAAGLADLLLTQPLRRAELVAALGQLAQRAPLAEALVPAAGPPTPAASAPAASEPAKAKPLTASLGAPTLAELLDPQVTGEFSRMAAAGKGEFVARVRQLYRENAPAAVKALIEASVARDCEGAARAAHALKSMSSNMGARLVAESAARLEAQARDLKVVNVDQAQVLHRQLIATLDVLEGYPPDLRPSALTKDTPPDEEALIADLSKALKNDELSLVYQPQFDREGETITGVETLIRWNHATRGFVSPAFFIPIAERYGLIGEVTQWVLGHAMAETADLGDITISFNASAVEFADPSFVDELAVLIARNRFNPKRLEIEVTETAVLAEEDEVRRNMSRLHELGLKIALDDFGVGYSSLSHLRLFPFDKLKIDRAFVTGCAENVQSATLVHAVVSIGRALGMKVVAEGVETEAQRKFLKVAGVHAMQGYLFAKPEPIEALKARFAAMRAPSLQSSEEGKAA
jgi:EAL domain-containing protein (putative c-di-GMP-specific phosphodiesterase class I)/signal transduction histidine kinase